MNASATLGFTLGDNSFTTDTVWVRVIVPSNVSIAVDDTSLNGVGVSTTCASGEHPYQRTRVRVYANGLDLTSLATNIFSTNATVADFVIRTDQHASYAILRGMTAGTTSLCLHSSCSVQSDPITVGGAQVSVTTMLNRVVTDVSFYLSLIHI